VTIPCISSDTNEYDQIEKKGEDEEEAKPNEPCSLPFGSERLKASLDVEISQMIHLSGTLSRLRPSEKER